MRLTNEEKALKAILDAVSDIRVDMGYLGFYLSQAEGPDKDRFVEMLQHAGLYSPSDDESSDADEEDSEDEEYIALSDITEPWESILERMLEDYNSVTPTESVACLIGILQNEKIDWSPYGEAQALAQRIVWKFQDENDTLVWITRENEIYLSQLFTEFDEDSSWPFDDTILTEDDFAYDSDANAWEYRGLGDVLHVVHLLALTYGDPMMILPWESIATQISDDEYDGFVDNYYSEESEDGEDNPVAKSLFDFYSQVADMSLELPDAGGEFGYDYGDGFLPAYSKVGRFNSFLVDLQDEHGWGVVYDECCGTCSSSSVADVRSEEGKENAPVFITWAQNAEGTWGTSGWVSHMAYHPDDEEQSVVMEVAAQNGLTVTVGESKGEPDGFLYIS